MAAGKLDLIIEQGATFKHRLVVKQGTGQSAPPANLTGYTARMQVRLDYDATQVVIALTTENGRLLITALDGIIDMEISATDTAALCFSGAVYDLEIQSSSGEVTRLVEGKVTLSREVTR